MNRLFRKFSVRKQSPARWGFQPRMESLESRLMMAADVMNIPTSSMPGLETVYESWQPASGIYFNDSNHQVNIHGTDLADKVEIYQQTHSVDINAPPLVVTHVTLGNYQLIDGQDTFVVTHEATFLQSISQINFWGYDGNDEFRNFSGIDCVAYGGEGDDVLQGGSGQNWLYGGAGNDRLYAGSGVSFLDGGEGDDVLVSLGGEHATLMGGAGKDSFWVDPSDTITDASNWEINNGFVHEVDQFMSYSFDGGKTYTPVSKELAGQNFVDPTPAHSGLGQQNFQSNPLFASAGPTKNDVFQGAVGDCYFVATLSAIADANPDYIQQMVVDLGDGTYAVRFYDNGQEVYVRVDGDLWVDGNNLKYAKLGQEGSTWVAIVEKAYAYFRKQQGSYASIASGNGTLQGHLGLTRDHWSIDDGVSPEQIVEWFQAGSPPGMLQNQINEGVLNLLHWIQDQLAMGKALTTGARSGVSNYTSIQLDDPDKEGNQSTYRRGQHIYMVDSVLTNSEGTPYALKLRDPYGSFVTLTDFTRIYFCIGRAVTWNVQPKTDLVVPQDIYFAEQKPFQLPYDPVLERAATMVTPETDPIRNTVFDRYLEPTMNPSLEKLGVPTASLAADMLTLHEPDPVKSLDMAFTAFGR